MLGWWPSGQWLATAGYAVFLPNPRGGTGHGHEFAAMVAGAVGTDEWTDILAGIDLLIAGGVADPGRLGIGGWSHGGFMAAWAVGQTGRFRAALMGAGISDWGMQVGVGELGTQEAGLGSSCGWEGPGPAAVPPQRPRRPGQRAPRSRREQETAAGHPRLHIHRGQAQNQRLHRPARRARGRPLDAAHPGST